VITVRPSGAYTTLATAAECPPAPGRGSPVAASTNETGPFFDPIVTVVPSGLIAAAEGSSGTGRITTSERRRSVVAS
jgi:hypothetical protein